MLRLLFDAQPPVLQTMLKHLALNFMFKEAIGLIECFLMDTRDKMIAEHLERLLTDWPKMGILQVLKRELICYSIKPKNGIQLVMDDCSISLMGSSAPCDNRR